jgi:hypothetical protein
LPYLSGGNVQARLYHAPSGNPAHLTQLDFDGSENDMEEDLNALKVPEETDAVDMKDWLSTIPPHANESNRFLTGFDR